MKWITVMLYVPLFEDRLLTGNDLEGDQNRHGLELLKNDKTCQHWSAHRVAARSC